MDNAIILLQEVCRICLEEPTTFDIFKTVNLAWDIFLSTGLKVTSTDKMPATVCSDCFKKIVSAKELRELAHKNDLYLKSLLNYDCNEESGDEKHSQHTSPSSSNEEIVKSMYFDNKISGSGCNIKNSKKHRKSSSTDTVSSTTEKEDESPIKSEVKLKREANQKCEVCNKTFETWKKFYLHQRTHKKRYPCPIDACSKLFATKGDLDKHIRAHTGEKPYQCHLCEKSFSQLVTLKIHKDKLHPNVDDRGVKSKQ